MSTMNKDIKHMIKDEMEKYREEDRQARSAQVLCIVLEEYNRRS